jgi:hypothetical protein
MAARIRSFRNFITPVDEASRNDLVIGDVVSVTSIDAATTYAWTLVFVPEGSVAGFSGSSTAVSPGHFNVDVPGSYLVRLIVDAGLGSESEQYVRLRALTVTTPLYLVAAGERRDLTGVIPVDADAQGWADDQNRNLNSLLSLVKPLTYSSNLLYVDANTGTEGRADYDTVQGAIDAAVADVPSASNQWQIVVRPGTYVENVTFAPWVHVSGDFSAPSYGDITNGLATFAVIDGTHTLTTGANDTTVLAGLQLLTSANTSSPTLLVSGSGIAVLESCRLAVTGVHVSQGAALEVEGGTSIVRDSVLVTTPAGGASNPVILQSDTSQLTFFRCLVSGNRGAVLNPNLRPNVNTNIWDSFLDYASDGILTDALSLDLSHTSINGSGTAISAHPGGAAYPNDVAVELRFCKVTNDIAFDITGIGGTPSLILTGVQYGTLVFPGGAPSVSTDLKSYSVFYDNTASGLTAANVQDAIDELSVGVASVTTATANPYNVLTTDNYVLVNVVAAGAVTVNLPAGATHAAKVVVIKDRKGDAGGATPINVVANGAETIDGLGSYPLASNYASVTLVFSGTEWSVV